MLRIKHEAAAVDSQEAQQAHAHTTLIITQDDMGRFWLSALCPKRKCGGELLLEVMPEQVREWEKLEIEVGDEKKGKGEEAA